MTRDSKTVAQLRAELTKALGAAFSSGLYTERGTRVAIQSACQWGDESREHEAVLSAALDELGAARTELTQLRERERRCREALEVVRGALAIGGDPETLRQRALQVVRAALSNPEDT